VLKKETTMSSLKIFKKLLKACIQADTGSIRSMIIAQINISDFDIICENEYIIAIPRDIDSRYPLVCSHYDTVRKDDRVKIVEKPTNILHNEYGILGADDRAGVAIALSLIKLNVQAVYCFFDEEECGAYGSKAFIADHPEIVKAATCYIGLDRRGSTDMALYDYSSYRLYAIVSKFGYKEAIGSFTDVSAIADTFPKACINLSVGFNSEHSKRESCDVVAAHITLHNMESIIPKATNVPFDDIESIGICSMYDDGYDYYHNSSYKGYGGYGYQDKDIRTWNRDDEINEYAEPITPQMREYVKSNKVEVMEFCKGCPDLTNIPSTDPDNPFLSCTSGFVCFEDNLKEKENNH